jgi:hypothetical protein
MGDESYECEDACSRFIEQKASAPSKLHEGSADLKIASLTSGEHLSSRKHA